MIKILLLVQLEEGDAAFELKIQSATQESQGQGVSMAMVLPLRVCRVE